MRHFHYDKMLVTLFPSTSVHEENFVLFFLQKKTPVLLDFNNEGKSNPIIYQSTHNLWSEEHGFVWPPADRT
jgi:hypothetical protein